MCDFFHNDSYKTSFPGRVSIKTLFSALSGLSG